MNYQVVHTTAGRLRIRVPQVANDLEYATKLKWLVESLDFVTSVRLNSAASSLIVSYDTGAVSSAAAQEDIVTCIQQASTAEIPLEPTPGQIELRQQVNAWDRLGLPVISLGVALIAAPLDLSIPLLVIGGLIAGAGVPIFRRAIAGVVDERKFKVDFLDSLWITLQTLQGQYVAPALMLSIIESAESLRDMTVRANERQTLEMLDLSDRYAWVERDGTQHQLPLQEVQKGDRVIVYAGEIIPVDGYILHGTAVIDEHNVTGEATPVNCFEGQEVYASTLVIKGQLCVIAERTGKDTRAALVAQFLRAPVGDTQVGDYVEEVADRLVVPTLFLSGSIFALTGNISPALAPLQLDFGTGIRIAAPTTILAALTLLARAGVFIRDGRALEVLARTDTVVFDLTGTLTEAIATSVIPTLTAQGLTTCLLKSDNQQAVSEIVRGLHNDGKTVAYVGDGISDTEALTYADVSVSFAKGTDIERETADVVILSNDLKGLIYAISIAKRAMEIVYQNIALVAIPNISVVIAGILFGLHPVAAVIINNSAALIAEMNGLRPLLGTGVASKALSPGKDPTLEGSAIFAAP